MLNYEELISEKEVEIEELEDRLELEDELGWNEKAEIRERIEDAQEEIDRLREEAKEMAYCKGDTNKLLGLRNSDFY